MLPYFLKKVPNSNAIQFDLDDKEMIFFIPSIFFDRKYAEIVDGKVSILGAFSYVLRDIKTGKDSELYNFNYPTVFDTAPSTKVNMRNYNLDGKLVKDDYTLLKYRKGDTVILSTKLSESIENAEIFYKMFTSGKIPTTIPYDELQEYFQENISLNGKDYNLNMQLFGLIIGESACLPNDETKLFRHSKMEDFNNYRIKNIKMSPKFISPYSSYTSEVYDEAIINASLISNKSGTSPMEKLFMGY